MTVFSVDISTRSQKLMAGFQPTKISAVICDLVAVGKNGLASQVIIIIIDNRGLNTRWCLTSLLLSLPTAAYLGQRGLTPAGLPHTTAQCHLTILGEAVLFCLNHPSFRTPGSLSFCCPPFSQII